VKITDQYKVRYHKL